MVAPRGKPIFDSEFIPSPMFRRYNVDPQKMADRAVDVLPEPEPFGSSTYTLVSSEIHGLQAGSGRHKLVIDVDFLVEKVVSTDSTHCHLFFEGMESLSWRKYKRLLKALAKGGVISWAYYRHSVRQRQSMVRRPGLKKLDGEVSSYEKKKLQQAEQERKVHETLRNGLERLAAWRIERA